MGGCRPVTPVAEEPVGPTGLSVRSARADEHSFVTESGRLAGAVLVEAHDPWQIFDRCYLSGGSMALLHRPDPAKEVAQPAQGGPGGPPGMPAEPTSSVGRRTSGRRSVTARCRPVVGLTWTPTSYSIRTRLGVTSRTSTLAQSDDRCSRRRTRRAHRNRATCRSGRRTGRPHHGIQAPGRRDRGPRCPHHRDRTLTRRATPDRLRPCPTERGRSPSMRTRSGSAYAALIAASIASQRHSGKGSRTNRSSPPGRLHEVGGGASEPLGDAHGEPHVGQAGGAQIGQPGGVHARTSASWPRCVHALGVPH